MSLLDLQGMSYRDGNSDGGRSMGGAGSLSSQSRYNCNTNSNFSVSVGLCNIQGF